MNLYRFALRLLVLLFLWGTSTQLSAQVWSSLGLEGGDVYAIAYDSATETLYASSTTKTYWLKKGEQVWQSSTSNTDDLGGSISQLLIHDNVMIGTVGCCSLKRSFDYGKTWQTLDSVSTTALRRPLLTQLRDTLYIFTDIPAVLRYSTDNGTSWTAIDTIPFFNPYRFYNDGKNLYVGASNGFYRREDDGTWNNKIGPNTSAALAAQFTGDTIVLQGNFGAGLFRSFNRGQEWTPLPPIKSLLSIYTFVLQNDTIWVGTSDGLYATPLDETTWVRMDSASTTLLSQTDIVFMGEQLVLATGAGVYAWEPENRVIHPFHAGWNSLSVSQFTLSSNKLPTESLIALAQNGLYIRNTANEEWIRRSGPRGLGAEKIFQTGGKLYAILADVDSLYVSENNARSWTSHLINRANDLHPTRIHAVEDTILVGGSSGTIYLSNDGAKSWERITLPRPEAISDITGTGSLFFATIADPVTKLYRSVDGEKEWTLIGLPDNNTHGRIIRYANNTLYLGTSEHGLYRSFDQGANWNRIYTPFPQVDSGGTPITSILSLDVYGDTVFVYVRDTTTLSKSALYSSIDNGTTWVRMELPIDSKAVGLTAFPDRSQLLIGTDGSGAYGTALVLSSVQELQRGRNNSATLGFNGGERQVEWKLEHPSTITITLHSIEGKNVATLFEGHAGAGSHTLPLPELSLPTGNYICVLRMESGEMVSMVVRIKN
ncbi:MAG: hypothetical protein KDD67_01315 [Ignavibacteriae bacterium]|nr:hypothetical protein [Ignavibacteriota bacterium]MCB9216542.1 hypothetical protein [Ignavibacteria bacterium]